MKKITIYYVDGGVSGNGNYGHQKGITCASDSEGKELFFNEVGDKTNNETELLAILQLLQTTRSKNLTIFSDSQLACHLIDKSWSTKIERLKIILREIWLIEKYFTVSWIPRESNKAGWIIEEKLGL